MWNSSIIMRLKTTCVMSIQMIEDEMAKQICDFSPPPLISILSMKSIFNSIVCTRNRRFSVPVEYSCNLCDVCRCIQGSFLCTYSSLVVVFIISLFFRRFLIILLQLHCRLCSFFSRPFTTSYLEESPINWWSRFKYVKNSIFKHVTPIGRSIFSFYSLMLVMFFYCCVD